MELQIKIHIGNELTDSKEVVERLVWENLNNKLDQYLNKFDKTDAEWTIEITTEKNKKGLFDAKIQANLDGQSYRFEREDYKKLDD
jgi:DNA helicase TIP49 (TBP-interacting protein)